MLISFLLRRHFSQHRKLLRGENKIDTKNMCEVVKNGNEFKICLGLKARGWLRMHVGLILIEN